MKIRMCLAIISLVQVLLSNAQSSHLQITKPLHIGDHMPDVNFKLQNFTKPQVHFSQFRGKVVILDFWFGACLGCIENFPKMEQMQQEFKDKLQIIMINFESQKTIDSIFAMHRRKSTAYRNPKLPSVTSDTLFHQLFSFQYYPHLVWIDSNGVIRAFTDPDQITEKNISALIEQNRAQMDMKLDDLRFDKKLAVLPQFLQYFPSHVKYYSSIMTYQEGVRDMGLQYVVDSSSGSVRILLQNASILGMLGFALSNGVYDDPYKYPMFDFGKRVELHVRDSSRWFFKEQIGMTKLKWDQLHLYTYESVQPMDVRSKLYEYMLFDLQKFFRFFYRIEKRQMECLALVRTSDKDKIKSKEGKALRLDDPRVDMNKLQMYATKTSWFVNAIAQANKNSPFIFVDNTDYGGRIDIELDKKDLTDINALRQALAKYDLDFVKKTLPVDVLVINDLSSQ